MAQPKDFRRQCHIAELRHFLKPGETIYTIRRDSGRHAKTSLITLLVLRDSEPHYITYAVGEILQLKQIDYRGYFVLRTSDTSNDRGEEMVERLQRALWPDGNVTYKHRWL